MQRQSQTSASLLSKTNRQFYVRRKKSPEDQSNFKIGKVLKTLLKKNENYCYAKPKHQVLLTQKGQQHSKTKINDKHFELAEAKRLLDLNLKKCHPGLSQLLKIFQKFLSSQTIQQIQFYQLDFYQVFHQIVVIEMEKNKMNGKNAENLSKAKFNKDNALLIENMKLEKQNKLLRKQINLPFEENLQIERESLLSDQFINSINRNVKCQQLLKGNNKIENQQFIKNFMTLERKLDVKTQQNQIMKRQLQSLKEQIYLIRQQKKQLKQRIGELKIKNENLCSEIINLQLKNKKMGVSDDRRELIMAMQNEQIDSYRMQIYQLRKLFSNLNKKYKGLIVKFKKNNADNSNKLGSTYNRQFQMFPEQFEAFEQIRSKFHPYSKVHLNNMREKKLQKSVIYQQFFSNKQTVNNKQGVKKCYSIGGQYYYPTFYSLLVQDLNFFGIDQNNFEHFNQAIKLNFISALRAIMDSKFNQFILYRQQPSCSSFPAFVLAWLNTFQVNEEKKIQKIPCNSISTRQTVCTFYVNLMSEKLNYSWEVIAFRQFLLQTFNNDELYFYLNLRYYLIRGDMCQDLSFSFQQIYYIDFHRTIISIGKIFKQNEMQTKRIYEQFLKRAVVYIRKKTFLDLHYVLRIMLEYYQSLKQKQIEKLLKTLQMVTQGKKTSICLMDFQKIFQFHFTFLSFTKIIELYRKCYCIGNGNVSVDVIITVLIQQNVFLKWVETLMINSPISIQQVQENQEESFVITPKLDWLYENEKKFRFMYNSQLFRQANQMGIQDLFKNVTKYSKIDSQSIYRRLQLSFQLCMMFSRKFYLSGESNNEQLKSVIQTTMQFLQSLFKQTIRKNEIHQIKRQLKQRAASKVIVRFYHKKKAEMTRSILYAYSSTVIKEQQQKKNQILRCQFMQIIQQARSLKNYTKISCAEECDFKQ